MGFFSAMVEELGARRRRLREALGDRGQSLFEFALLSAFTLGSIGLFVREWGAKTAPWGFALPFVFLLGYAALDARRQSELAAGADEERTHKRYDLAALALAIVTAGLAIFAFVQVLSVTPPAPPVTEEEVWEPPPDTVNFDLQP